MVVRRQYLLNRFLLGCIFIGIVMILIKEKEGFATHYYHLDELYKGPLLEVKSQSQEPVKLIKAPKPKKNQENIVKMKNYSKVSDNYSIHPCNDKGYYNEICHNFYKPNDVVIGPKQKACQPGYECRRVGFFCSKID
tara:strand:- start:88 stop:498 length:411 start_codon:yes stop_codon:yes gene_type:complete